ncbi:pheromone-regulated protein PRM7-like [Pecten maximus]|uniref:pheromone-regulated protein PRM7-like n=1 Tax=Pecten maximus TaxID=6579 RepID=UPI001459023F|nr:pheromone-regulated protein PRM7-like [Pecten maximus]
MWIYMFMCCSFVIYPGYSHHYDHEEFIFDEGQYGFTKYRLFMDKYHRNTAYEICQLYGGNIIRLDSFKKLLRIMHLNTEEWNYELHHDFWIDLVVDPTDDSFLWTSDCEPFDPLADWNGMIANFDYNADKMCVVYKRGSIWNSKNCDSDAMVICETFETGNACTFGSPIDYPLQIVPDIEEAGCYQLCLKTAECWSYTYISPQRECVLNSDTSQNGDANHLMSTTKIKSCYGGELIQTVNQTWSIGVYDDYSEPVYNCTAGLQQTTLNITNLHTQSQQLQLQSLHSTNNKDVCSTVVVTKYATTTVIDTTTNDLTVSVTASPRTVVVTTEIPTTLVITSEVFSQLVTTVVSTDIATTTVEIPTTVVTTVVIPAPNVTITATPSIVPVTTVVSEVVTTTTEVPTTIVVTETPSVIVSTVPVTVAMTSMVIVPTTVVRSEIETYATTLVITTTIHATTWSSVPQLAPTELAKKLENLVKNLTVPKTSTNAYRRKLMCAEDTRQSAKTVGFVGIVLLVIPLGLLIGLDLPSVAIHISKLRESFKG